jgi:hypothetical protein
MRASALLAVVACITPNLMSLAMAGDYSDVQDGVYLVCSPWMGKIAMSMGKSSSECDFLDGDYCQEHCSWYVHPVL